MKGTVREWIDLAKHGRIPRLGQLTAVVAAAVLAWLLLLSASPDRSNEPAATSEVQFSLAHAEGDVGPTTAGSSWVTGPDVTWRTLDGPDGHFGFREDPLWLRATVRNPGDRSYEGVLVYKFPYTDRLAFYGYDMQGQPETFLAGDSMPVDARLPRSHFPAFPVFLGPGETRNFYIRVETTSVVLTPVYLLSAKHFDTVNLRDQILFAALFGAVAAVCLYAMSVFVTVRDKSFVDFVIFSLVYTFYVAVASGMGQTWLWPGAHEHANALFFIVQGLLFASGVRFFQRYLRTPQLAPRVDIIFRVLIFLGLLTSLTPLLPSIIGKVTIAFVAGPGAVFVFGISIFMAMRGMHRARIVALGWGFSQLTSVYIYLRIFDITPYTAINHYLTAIGCGIATIFFAMALALGLRRQQEQLLLVEKLNETRSSFMAGMSHELRTPLNAIQGFSEMMRTEMLGPIQPPIYREYAADIHNSSQHMLDLVDKILDISRLEQGEYNLRMEPNSLNEVMRETITTMKSAADSANVEIRIDQPDGDASAVFDRPAIKRVMENLVSNAVKFSEPGSVVTLSVRERPGRAELVVADKGAGMEADRIEQLLVPFESVRVEAYKAKAGAGLGLPLANALVKRHQGDLSFETTPGEGTTVTVSLPSKGL